MCFDRGVKQTASILACHERRLVGEGVARVVERAVDAEVQVASTLDEARRLAAARQFDLVICSDTFSLELSVAEIAHGLGEEDRAIPFVVLARAEGRQSVAAAVTAGADGYVALGSAHEQLGEAVVRVLGGHKSFPPALQMSEGVRLSKRQFDVLQCFELGLSDKETATRLGLSVSTVKAHARAIFLKLSVSSRARAVHQARQLDLL